jgi:hypothetical protein
MKRCLPIIIVKIAERVLVPLARLRERAGVRENGHGTTRHHKLLFAMPVLLLLSVSAHGALNKWVDAEGKTHYSDEPPPPNVKALTLATPSAASGTPAQKTTAERETERKKALKSKEEAAQKASTQQQETLAKQKSCEAAKANLSMLESNTPLSTKNDKGESVIMDDSARQQQMETIRKGMGAVCN